MAYIYWNMHPELVELGPLAIRWYGLFFAGLFVIGYFIGRWMLRTEKRDDQHLDTILLYIVIGAVVGARLGHVIFYEPGLYFSQPWRIIRVWEGGLASHGGAIGVLVAIWLFTLRHKEYSYLWMLDRIVVGTALGGAMIRLGNLFNSEILGHPTTVPWAFVFVRVDPVPRHPVQLYESIAYLFTFVVLLSIYRRFRAQTPRGLLLGLFLVMVFVFRFLLEFLKQPQAAYENGFTIHVGQWLSIPFIIAGLAILWRVMPALRTKQREHA